MALQAVRSRVMQELIDRLRGALAEAGHERAVLSHPETLAHLCLFDPAPEEWPVANPFVASPALLVLEPDGATLLVASFHAGHAARSPVPVEQYRSYDYERAPAPAAELEAALRALTGGPCAPGPAARAPADHHVHRETPCAMANVPGRQDIRPVWR